MNKYHNHNGAALITSMLIVALVVTVVGALMLQERIALRRTVQVLNADQAVLYAQGVEQWAIGLVKHDFDPEKNLIWPKVLPLTQIENGQISGLLYDLQNRFNLNSLLLEEQISAFQQLVLAVDSELGEAGAEKITDATRAWIKNKRSGYSELEDYDAYYAEQSPPYTAPHRSMASISELRLVKGMTPELYNKLLPHVAVLPGVEHKININTATLPVLMSLNENLSFDDAISIIELRNELGGFKTVEEFTSHPLNETYKIKGTAITTDSQYFLVRADTHIAQQHLIVYSLLQKSIIKGKVVVNLKWQSRNTL